MPKRKLILNSDSEDEDSEESSAEEAEEKAEELAKNFSKTFNQILQYGYKDYSDQPSSGWSMTCDEVILQVDLTYQVNTCMRPFIPNYDD